MPKLGVNVDHVATVRQARRVDYPDPLQAALAAERAGADAITVHLREDRRHILDSDLMALREHLRIHLNQELAPVDGMVELALRIRPDEACFVPERREEITTEGGIDAVRLAPRLAGIIERMRRASIVTSLFIDPEPAQIAAAARLGANCVELHTGAYANLADRGLGADALRGAANRNSEATSELEKIRAAIKAARALGLRVNAGHGLNYRNVAPVAAMGGIEWLHIGHAIVARAIAVGMERAVSEMIALVRRVRPAATRARGGRRREASKRR